MEKPNKTRKKNQQKKIIKKQNPKYGDYILLTQWCRKFYFFLTSLFS